MRSFLAPLLRKDAPPHTLENIRNGAVVARDLLTAFDSARRNKGLLGRDRLAEGTAMIIAPCTAVHTFFMRFAIDIAFVARDGRVMKVRAAVPPWRIAAALGGHAVVEMPAGALARSGTVVGDVLSLREVDAGANTSVRQIPSAPL